MSGGDGEPTAMDNAQLETLWDAITVDTPAVQQQQQQLLMGVPLGGTSFAVPEIHRYNAERGNRILPEDGTYTAPGEDPTEDADVPGRYGHAWRAEAMTREQILEHNPDYQFITLVAGKTNAPIERLYDDDSLSRAFRTRLAEAQTRVRVQEVQMSSDKLEANIDSLNREQRTAREQLLAIETRRASDRILNNLPDHAAAVKDYIRVQQGNVDRIAVSVVLNWGSEGGGGIRVPTTAEAVMKHAARVLLRPVGGGGDEMVDDNPDIGVHISRRDIRADVVTLPVELLLQAVFYGTALQDVSLVVTTPQSVRVSLLNAFTIAFPGSVTADLVRNTPDEISPGADIPSGGGSLIAPSAIINALQRLLALKVLAEDPTRQSAADFEARVTRYRRDMRAGTDTRGIFAKYIDSKFAIVARSIARATALTLWFGELHALTRVLRTAFDIYNAESLLAAPRITAIGGAPRSVADIALMAAREAEADARARGMSDAGVLRVATDARDAVFAKPPNHLFSVQQTRIDTINANIARVEGILDDVGPAIRDGPPTADPIPALSALQLGGAQGLDIDTSLWQRGVRPAAFSAQQNQPWALAMSWYEKLGGTLFTDRKSWTIDDENNIVLDNDVYFPATPRQRLVDRERDAVPKWSPLSRPPAQISPQTRMLWNLYTPVYTTVISKLSAAAPPPPRSATAAAAAAPPPRKTTPTFTPNERVVFAALSGGAPPEQAHLAAHEFPGTRYPIFVFLARLVEADMASVHARVRAAVQQRDGLIDAARARIEAMLRGVPVPRPVTEPPYQHRRGWVERPEHSGEVKLKPIVASAIEDAWGTLQRAAPHIVAAVGGDVEVLQHHPDLRNNFAELVAVHMSLVAQRFPTRYVQLGQRTHNQIDLLNVVNRFRAYEVQPGYRPFLTTTTITTGGGGAAAAAARARVRVHVPPINRPVLHNRRFTIV